MLELPEVEVLRKDLEKEVVGKKVKDVTVETASIVKPFHRTRPDFVKALEGRKIEAARRRGQVIFLDLDEDMTWIIDAGTTGSLHRETATEKPGEGTHLAVSFTIGGAIHLSDPADEPTASTGVVPTEEAMEAAGVDADAMDPFEDNPTWPEFRERLRLANRPLKAVFTDSDVIVGIGEVYSDEILWESGLRHDHPSAKLSTQEVRRLYRAMMEVINAAMKAAGSTLDESEADQAVDDDGEVADHLKIYGRDGLPCLRCRKPVKRTRIKKGVYTYHCEQCMI